MNKFKGDPLNISFQHIVYTDKNGDPVYKTVARCNVDGNNIPYQVFDKFFEMFANDKCFTCYTVSLYAETVCKGNDEPDFKKGERVARKKIMKKYMSMVNQATIATYNELFERCLELRELEAFTQKCRCDIVNFLKKQ